MDLPKGIPPILASAVASAGYLQRCMDDFLLAPYRESLPYSWHVISSEEVSRFTYYGREIVTQRNQWIAPEKTRERVKLFLSFHADRTERPEELDENNTAIVYRTPSFDHEGSHTTFDSVFQAEAYIDAELALDAQAAGVADIVEKLKDMPCTCGEYGSINEREYLRMAIEMRDVVNSAGSTKPEENEAAGGSHKT